MFSYLIPELFDLIIIFFFFVKGKFLKTPIKIFGKSVSKKFLIKQRLLICKKVLLKKTQEPLTNFGYGLSIDKLIDGSIASKRTHEYYLWKQSRNFSGRFQF